MCGFIIYYIQEAKNNLGHLMQIENYYIFKDYG